MDNTTGFLNVQAHSADLHSPRPVLSLVIAGVDNYRTVFETLRACEEQTIVDKLELLVVIQSLHDFDAPDNFAARHPRVRLVETGHPMLLNQARYIGLVQAKADFVFMLEDHCLPARDCMERIYRRIQQGTWCVIGPSIVSGNRYSMYGKAANLLTYGEWMGYTQAQERRYVTGYSSAWRRDALLRLEPNVEKDLTVPNRLQERLVASGERLYFEPAAVMLHWEASSARDICRILFRQGKGMGYIRCSDANFSRRVAKSLAYPLLIAYRTVRAARAWRRTNNSSWKVLAVIPFFAVVWCTGELFGYWTHDGAAAIAAVSEVERKRQPYIDEEREPLRRPWAVESDTVS